VRLSKIGWERGARSPLSSAASLFLFLSRSRIVDAAAALSRCSLSSGCGAVATPRVLAEPLTSGGTTGDFNDREAGILFFIFFLYERRLHKLCVHSSGDELFQADLFLLFF
jgi:hypothetical protein